MIAVLMMDPMNSNPENRSTLERQRRTKSQKVFNPLRRLKSPMGQQPVIPHTNTKVDSKDPQNRENGQPAPTEVEKGSNCANVECANKACRDPVDTPVISFPAHAYFCGYRNACC